MSGPPESAEPSRAEPGRADLTAFFGAAWPRVDHYAALLQSHGETLGLIGPRELPRLWSRHILNSAALEPFLPRAGAAADVGSGAGLPGVVLAAMRPDLEMHLVEPMQRRAAWLREVVDALGIRTAIVHESRAEDLRGRLEVDVVTARAVASLDRLARWTMPLVRPGGRLVLLKGRRAAEEVAAADRALRRSGAERAVIHEVDVLARGDVTYVVEITKK